MHRLDAPALTNELGCQPVQQRLIRGALSRLSEIIGAGYNPLAEVMRPNAVDHEASRHRMIGSREPLSEGTPPTCCFRPRAGRRNLER